MKKLLAYILPLSFLFFVLLVKDKALTQDLGRHIKLGEIITSCRCVPKTNLFSYTMPNQTFINHHWLSEVVFYGLYLLGGVSAVVAFKIGVFLLVFGLVIWLSLKRASPFWVTAFSMPYILMFSERFDARPEIFSFLFLILFIIAIERYRASKSVLLLLFLPLIQVFWVNMHIYFLVGVGLLGLLIIEQILLSGKKIDKRLLLVTGITGLATIINPNGITGALYPLEVLHGYGYSIVENQNIFFLNTFFFNSHILIFEILSVIIFFGILVYHQKKDLFWIFSTLFAVTVSYWMIRNFPLFVLITFPFITYLFTNISKKVFTENKSSQKKLFQSGIVAVLAVVTAGTVMRQVSSPFFGFGYVDPGQEGIDFFKQNAIQGPIFNNFDIGSYLIYRLYPEQRVFVDGRPEAYTVSFFNVYKKMQEDPSLFAKETKKYRINAIIFSQTDITPWAQIFLSWIIKDKNWKMVYADGYTVIFVRNDRQNKQLIAKYAGNPVR